MIPIEYGYWYHKNNGREDHRSIISGRLSGFQSFKKLSPIFYQLASLQLTSILSFLQMLHLARLDANALKKAAYLQL